jgi:transposase
VPALSEAARRAIRTAPHARLFAAYLREAKANADARLLMTIPGVGPLKASAIVATLGERGIHQFTGAKNFAAWLGLVQGQHGTGGKPRLRGSSSGTISLHLRSSATGPPRHASCLTPVVFGVVLPGETGSEIHAGRDD